MQSKLDWCASLTVYHILSYVGAFGENNHACGAVKWGTKWKVKSCEDCWEGKGGLGRPNERGGCVCKSGERDDKDKECCLPEIHVGTRSSKLIISALYLGYEIGYSVSNYPP